MAKQGYIREIDKLGRVVIPKQFRKQMNVPEEGGEVVVTCKNGTVSISKLAETCIFCRSRKKLTEFKERPVCAQCLAELKGETGE
ncbi:MAG: AbrB family transcriptional regulator [Clostridia bacterium]|nr:AbrB family transcriptional regulator [Clostridia bacterium]MBQ4243881.1 AbrB family transcriptional regulator [Clostridia bacterium]